MNVMIARHLANNNKSRMAFDTRESGEDSEVLLFLGSS